MRIHVRVHPNRDITKFPHELSKRKQGADIAPRGLGSHPGSTMEICQHLCDLSQGLTEQLTDSHILAPQCLSQLGSDCTEQPPTNLTGQNSDHCSTATSAKLAQIGQRCRQEQARTAHGISAECHHTGHSV